MTTSEAAARLGITQGAVEALIRRKRLVGTRRWPLGWYNVDERSVSMYAKTRRWKGPCEGLRHRLVVPVSQDLLQRIKTASVDYRAGMAELVRTAVEVYLDELVGDALP